MKRLIAIVAALAALSGCATFHGASSFAQRNQIGAAASPEFWMDASGAVHEGAPPTLAQFRSVLRVGIRYGTSSSAISLVDCAVNTACTQSGPVNTGTGDPAYLAFAKLNGDFQQVENMFGATGLLVGNGDIPNPLTAATYSNVVSLWSGCASGTPLLSYTGSCVAGGSSSQTWPTNAGIMVYSGSQSFGTSYNATNAIPANYLPAALSSSTSINGTSVPASAGTLIGTGNLGTGVDTALGVAVGSAGAFVVNGGALGTPASGTLTNATGLPFSAIAGGTNTTAAMVVGSGASLVFSGTGILNANEANGGTFPANANVLGTNGSSQPVAATAAQVLALVNNQTCNPQTGTTYTFVIGDANNCVTMSNTAANTVTVPANASVAFAVGTTLTVLQANTGITTIQGAGTPVTLESLKYGSSTTQAYAMAGEYDCISLQKTATDTWFVSACSYNPGAGSMVYPGAGIPVSTGTAWGTSITPGTGVDAALAVNVGSAGAFVTNGGALGIPASGTLTNATGLPISTGVSGLGTGVASALAQSTVTYLIDTGTAFTLGTGTGACATDSVVAAGAANGEVACTGTTGASTLVVNLPTAAHGWACSASDITQKTTLPESAFTTTSATVSGSVTASDDIVIGCTGF